MKTITITGRAGSGKTTWASGLYFVLSRANKHVVVDDDGQIYSNKPFDRPSQADILIITMTADVPLNAVSSD